MKPRFLLGQFNPASAARRASMPPGENNTPLHDALALEASEQSFVLLKIDGTLPWKADTI